MTTTDQLINLILTDQYELMRYDIATEKGINCGVANYQMLELISQSILVIAIRVLPETKDTCITGKSYVSFPDEFPLEGKFNVSIGTDREHITLS